MVETLQMLTHAVRLFAKKFSESDIDIEEMPEDFKNMTNIDDIEMEE